MSLMPSATRTCLRGSKAMRVPPVSGLRAQGVLVQKQCAADTTHRELIRLPPHTPKSPPSEDAGAADLHNVNTLQVNFRWHAR